MLTVAEVIDGAKNGDLFSAADGSTWRVRDTAQGLELNAHPYSTPGWVSVHTAKRVVIPGLTKIEVPKAPRKKR